MSAATAFCLWSFGLLMLAGEIIMVSVDTHLPFSDFRVYWLAFHNIRTGTSIHPTIPVSQVFRYAVYLCPPPLAVLGSPLAALGCSGVQQQFSLACPAGNLWDLGRSLFLAVAVLLLLRALGRRSWCMGPIQTLPWRRPAAGLING